MLTFLLLLATATPAPPPTGPVAVMPFKNLNADPKIDWLKLGIAETMISDLKRSGSVDVVERDQIDRAMTQLALSGPPLAEDVEAARVGTLVGAKTVVVGSYQQAGTELRINARFVSVETGVVLDAAKTTGPSTKVFELQDQIVDKLLKVPSGVKVANRPARKSTAKSFDAYRLYAMSLSVASDADRVGFLRQSIQVDPDFRYSQDDLDALQKRMAGYAAVADARFQADEKALYDLIVDPKAKLDDRTKAVPTLLQSLYAHRRWHALESAAAEIYAAKELAGAREVASAQRVEAAAALREIDVALQLGEKHLQEFPGGSDFGAVQSTMQRLIDERKKRAGRKAEFDADVKEKRDDLLASGGGKVPPARQIEWDYAPCIAATWDGQDDGTMLDACRAFLDAHGNEHGDPADDYVSNARFSVVRALASLGRFDEARPMAQKLIAGGSPRAGDLQTILDSFPAD